jgi:hypothetical protein
MYLDQKVTKVSVVRKGIEESKVNEENRVNVENVENKVSVELMVVMEKMDVMVLRDPRANKVNVVLHMILKHLFYLI